MRGGRTGRSGTKRREQFLYEDEAKRAWLAILDAREWEKAADAVEAIAQTASIGGDASQVEAAKAAGMSLIHRHGRQAWRRPSRWRPRRADWALTEDCDAGDDVACETLQKRTSPSERG